MKTALIIGASGLTGKELVNQLIVNTNIQKIIIFTRRKLSLNNEKITEHIVDFNSPNEWKDLLVGDILFSCLGTTLKLAGSKEKQYKIDVTYTINTIKNALKNKKITIAHISSMGAKKNSKNFYLAMKGELEELILSSFSDSIYIFRPSILDGSRVEKRPFEKTALDLIYFFNTFGILSKYAPTKIATLASSMIKEALSITQEKKIIEADSI